MQSKEEKIIKRKINLLNSMIDGLYYPTKEQLNNYLFELKEEGIINLIKNNKKIGLEFDDLDNFDSLDYVFTIIEIEELVMLNGVNFNDDFIKKLLEKHEKELIAIKYLDSKISDLKIQLKNLKEGII